MRNITRRAALTGLATLPLSATPSLATPTTSELVEQRREEMIDKIENGEIYLPTPEEVFALTDSKEQADQAALSLSKLDSNEAKINLEVRKEQEALTELYRSENKVQAGSRLIHPKPYMSPQYINNAYQIMTPDGLHHPYTHTGVLNVLRPNVLAIRPNWSRGRVFMYDAVIQGTYWTVWRSRQVDWVWLNWKRDGWGARVNSSVTKVERYRLPGM